LSEVLPSAGLRETVQEFCGALFVDRRLYKIENILFLIGTGQNGKGVFSEAIQNMLGAGNYTSFSVERLVKSSDKAGNIAAMNGKLANICPDMSKGDISGGDFKIIVSGENIQARFQYGRSFQATELPLIIANVNEMPVTTDHSYGHHRRPLPIPFNVTISNETKDVELPTKLRGEVSGIFNWVYEGRKRFIKNDGKFSEGPEVLAEKERIKIESNSVLQFLAANEYSAKRSEGAVEIYLTNKELYKAYQDHCNDYGKKNVFEMINMGKIMNQEGYEAVRKTRGRGYMLYMGGKKFEEVITEEEGVEDVFKRRPGDNRDLPF
jgi:putative DNA primase/helicase